MKGVVVRQILTKDYGSRAQVHLVDMQSMSNNNNNKGLTSVSSSKDDVRDVPSANIAINRFTQNDSNDI